MSDTYLTVQEVARIFRVSKMTVYRMVHDGSLKAIRVGRSYRILRSSFEEYVRQEATL